MQGSAGETRCWERWNGSGIGRRRRANMWPKCVCAASFTAMLFPGARPPAGGVICPQRRKMAAAMASVKTVASDYNCYL